MLASAGWDNQIALWELPTGRKLAALHGHLDGVYCVAFSPDGQRLATSSVVPKDAVKLWDLATQREILSLEAEGEYFCRLGFSPDGSRLVALSLTGIAHLWHASSWEEIEAKQIERRPK